MIRLAVALLSVAAGVGMAGDPAQFAMVNHRQPNEDHPRFLSTSVFSCDFGIRVVNDEGRSRNRVDALEQALRSTLGASLNGHSVTLNSYQIYFNNAADKLKVTDAVIAASAGGVAVGYRALAPKCDRSRTPHGWFSTTELTNGNPPFVSEIEAVVDGRPVSVRSVFSPSVKLSVPPTALSSKAKKNFSDAKAGPEVDRAIDKANAAFVAEVGRMLG